MQTTPASIRLTLATPPDRTYDVTATVLTADGHFVKDIALVFAMDSGSVTPERAITNGNGAAQAVASAMSSTTLTVSAGSLTASMQVDGVPSTLQLNSTSAVAGDVVPFALSGFVSGNSPTVSTSWTFGDGGTAVNPNANASHRYVSAGSYLVTVMATDSLGRSASTSASVQMERAPAPPAPTPPTPPAPPPALSASLTCTPAAAATATPTMCNVSATYGGATVPANAITETRWEWGDGTPVDVKTTPPTIPLGAHSYAQPGTYMLVLDIWATTTAGAKTATTSKVLVIP